MSSNQLVVLVVFLLWLCPVRGTWFWLGWPRSWRKVCIWCHPWHILQDDQASDGGHISTSSIRLCFKESLSHLILLFHWFWDISMQIYSGSSTYAGSDVNESWSDQADDQLVTSITDRPSSNSFTYMQVRRPSGACGFTRWLRPNFWADCQYVIK